MPRVPAAAARSLSAAAGLNIGSVKGDAGRPCEHTSFCCAQSKHSKQRYFSSFAASSDSPISADKQSIWLSV
jgi:hypothetical protein